MPKKKLLLFSQKVPIVVLIAVVYKKTFCLKKCVSASEGERRQRKKEKKKECEGRHNN